MKDWLGLTFLACLALSVAVPEGCTYHGRRLLKLGTKPSLTLLETEIERAAKANKLPKPLLTALVRVESGFNPLAVSKVGARGIAQIMPFNAARCGLLKDHLWDATFNLRCGALILRQELDRLGNVEAALTVYNCGRVKCAEGKTYAKKVLALSQLNPILIK